MQSDVSQQLSTVRFIVIAVIRLTDFNHRQSRFEKPEDPFICLTLRLLYTAL